MFSFSVFSVDPPSGGVVVDLDGDGRNDTYFSNSIGNISFFPDHIYPNESGSSEGYAELNYFGSLGSPKDAWIVVTFPVIGVANLSAFLCSDFDSCGTEITGSFNVARDKTFTIGNDTLTKDLFYVDTSWVTDQRRLVKFFFDVPEQGSDVKFDVYFLGSTGNFLIDVQDALDTNQYIELDPEVKEGNFKKGSDFPSTARSGEFFDRDSDMVYGCDVVEDDGKDKQCKNPVNKGTLKKSHVFIGGDWQKKSPVLNNITLDYVDGLNSWMKVETDGEMFTNAYRKKVVGDSHQILFQKFVLEDGVVKTTKESNNLNGYQKVTRLDAGLGWGSFEYGNHNISDVEVYPVINDMEELGKNHTFYVDGVAYATINYGNVDDRQLLLLHFNDWVGNHNWTFNPTDTITSEDENWTMIDASINSYPDQDIYNDGAGVYGECYTSNYRKNFIAGIYIAGYTGTGITFSNFSWIMQADTNNGDGNINFSALTLVPLEGNNTIPGTGYNMTWQHPNDTAIETWTGGTWDSGLKPAYVQSNFLDSVFPVADVWTTYEFSSSGVDDNFDLLDGWVVWQMAFSDALAGEKGGKVHTLESAFGWQVYVDYDIANVAPTCTVAAADTNKSISEDTGVDVDTDLGAAGGVECTDNDADTIYYTSYASSGVGGFNIVGANLSVYPTANSTGEGYITVNASDGITGDAFFDVNVSWTAVNDFPWWNETANNTYSYNEDSGNFNIWDADGLNNTFWDVEENHLPYNCTASVNDTNVVTNITYDDAGINANSVANATGSFILTVNCSDKSWESSLTSFDIVVNAVNDAPWQSSGISVNNVTTDEDFTTFNAIVVADLNANFSDVEENNAPTSYEFIDSTNSSSSCYFDGSNNWGCSSLANQSGTDYYKFSLNDSGGLAVIYDWQLTVTAVNDVPVVPVLFSPVNESNITSLNFSWYNSTDIEGDAIFYIFEVVNLSFDTVYYNESVAEIDYITDEENISSVGLNDGNYFWHVLAKDVGNSSWSEYWYFTYDTTPPLVIIDSPINTSYNNETIDFNFTAVDNIFPFEDLTFWYSNDSGTINYSISSNSSLVFEQDYNYHLNLWVNDTNGNENVTSIDFMVDTVNPTLSIVSPHSEGSYSNNVPLEISAVDTNLDTVWYEIIVRVSGNSKVLNTTFSSNISLQNLDVDNYRLHVYANDSLNNIATTSVDFGLVESSTGIGGGGGIGGYVEEVEEFEDVEEVVEVEKKSFFAKIKGMIDVKPSKFYSRMPVFAWMGLITLVFLFIDFRKKLGISFFGVLLSVVYVLFLMVEDWKSFLSSLARLIFLNVASFLFPGSVYPLYVGGGSFFLAVVVAYFLFLRGRKRRKRLSREVHDDHGW